MSQIQTFDFSANLLRVVPWQYQDATRLLTWLQNKQNYLDQDHTAYWQDWARDVFNINTANYFGVAVWAIILDLPLLSNLTPSNPDNAWAFGSIRKNFGFGNFVSVDPGQNLSLEQRRILIKMRYKQLISRGTIPEINKIMIEAWGDLGAVYCVDNHDMSITYVFDFTPPPWITYAINTLNILPRPAGVGYTIQAP